MKKNEEKSKYVAKTLAGLEEILAGELKDLGATEIKILTRAVEFQGNRDVLYRANYCCRCALRFLLPLASFQVHEQNDLYTRVVDLDWDLYLDPGKTLAVDAVINKSVFTNSHFVAQKTKDAIVDRFRRQWGVRPSVNLDDPDIRINVYLTGEECTVALDSSGASLHKRGYRKMTGLAPINEVLAAGMIRLSGWDGKMLLLDPMCGSGTILIEAALLARKIPAGFFREKFGFMKWKDFDPEQWHILKEKENDKIIQTCPELYGSDISPKAISDVRHNLAFTGLVDFVHLEVKPFDRTRMPAENGMIITNPPYDERLRLDDTIGFYKSIGDVLKKKYTSYEAWVISSDLKALKFIGLHPSKKITLFNGPLECRFVQFKLY
ncbi:MAG: THUMP domain-containing protein [Bacteroidota bacterium]|nr:THUMP domain-containing protein [Bacteroidota bacterium]